MTNVFKRSLDSFRAAPLGFALVAAGSGIPFGYEAFMSAVTDNGANVVDALVMTPPASLWVAMGGLLISRQLKLKHRLEASVERVGYTDRAFATSTDEWCCRQTARVVCKNADALSEYAELCESKSETARLKWLPHI